MTDQRTWKLHDEFLSGGRRFIITLVMKDGGVMARETNNPNSEMRHFKASELQVGVQTADAGHDEALRDFESLLEEVKEAMANLAAGHHQDGITWDHVAEIRAASERLEVILDLDSLIGSDERYFMYVARFKSRPNVPELLRPHTIRETEGTVEVLICAKDYEQARRAVPQLNSFGAGSFTGLARCSGKGAEGVRR